MSTDYTFGLKRTASLNLLFGENHDLPDYIKFQKQTDLFNKNFDRFQATTIVIDRLKQEPVLKDWTSDIDKIMENCSRRAADLLYGDFIMAWDSKSMKIVNKDLQELLDYFLAIKEFLEFVKMQANGGPKKPERAKLGWYS